MNSRDKRIAIQKGTPDTCGEPAASFIPRWGMSFACVLPKGHEGVHQRGGACVKHGEYVGEKCPDCLPQDEPVIPTSDPVREQAEKFGGIRIIQFEHLPPDPIMAHPTIYQRIKECVEEHGESREEFERDRMGQTGTQQPSPAAPEASVSVRLDGETRCVPEPPASEPSTEWSESVELVRAEMMRRFSNQLSMEQIASCAYAIATKFRANVRSQIEVEREILRVAISKLRWSGLQKSPMYSCDEVEEIFRARKDGGK